MNLFDWQLWQLQTISNRFKKWRQTQVFWPPTKRLCSVNHPKFWVFAGAFVVRRGLLVGLPPCICLLLVVVPWERCASGWVGMEDLSLHQNTVSVSIKQRSFWPIPHHTTKATQASNPAHFKLIPNWTLHICQGFGARWIFVGVSSNRGPLTCRPWQIFSMSWINADQVWYSKRYDEDFRAAINSGRRFSWHKTKRSRQGKKVGNGKEDANRWEWLALTERKEGAERGERESEREKR